MQKEFWVDRAEQRGGRYYATGRVHWGPISLNDEFISLSPFTGDRETEVKSEAVAVRLRVMSIYKPVLGSMEAIDSPYTGELELAGDGWERLARNWVLRD